MQFFFRLAIVAFLLAGIASAAIAHEAGLSTAVAKLGSNSFELTNAFAPADGRLLVAEAERAQLNLTPQTFEAEQAWLIAVAPQLWDFRCDGAVVTPVQARVELLAGDNISFHLTYPLSQAPNQVTLRSNRLDALPPGHRQLIVITNDTGETLAETLLSRSHPTVELPQSPMPDAKASTGRPPGFWGFFELGIEHIWTGYDHLLFLLGLLTVCRTSRSVIAIVTTFTVAHSLTLGLATVNLVNLSPRIVEPAIAASIVFVGVENIFRREGQTASRLALTFIFGLVHGFGFAGVLRDLVGVGGRGIVMPLFSFNLGVEVGQMFVASIVLPLLWVFRKNEFFVRRGVPLVSTVVVALGLYWLLERTFFFGN